MEVKLLVDVYSDITPKGITRSLYVGDACEAVFEHEETWQEHIERVVGYYILPNSNTMHPRDVEELKKHVKGLQRAAKLLSKEIEKYDESAQSEPSN